MERDEQRIKLDAELETKSHEINSNSCTFEKRKKKIRKKHCTYLHEWLDKSHEAREETSGLYRPESDQLLNHPSSYWPHPSTGQRHVYADGATMCYPVPSVPLGYAAMEPFYSMYQPPMQLNHPWAALGMRAALPTRDRAQRVQRSSSSSQRNKSVWTASKPSYRPAQAQNNAEQEFASLPPDNQSRDSDASRGRRFSDPGLGPSPSGNEQSDESSTSSCSRSSSPTGGIVLSLVEQVSALRNSNRQLCRQLRDTQGELQSLKLQVATWKQTADYQPGLIADLVREVRDASRVREEALLSRLHNISLGSVPQSSGDKMAQGHVVERLIRLEQQMLMQQHGQPLQTNNGRAVAAPQDVSNLDVKRVEELRCKLQEAVSSRQEAEMHAETLEKLVGALRKKINGLTVDDKLDPCPSSLENTSESLTSICSSTGSTHSPQVTMSGPVTDL